MFTHMLPRLFRHRGQILRRLVLLFLCLALPNITACDYGQPKKVKNKFTHPPYETSKTITIEKARDIAALAPPEENISVAKIDIFKNKNELSKPKGPLIEGLFSTPTSDDIERFTRLEKAVQVLANKFNKISPTITRLTEIDRDLENLTYQLEILVNERENFIKPAPEYRDAVLPTPAKKAEPEFREAAIPTPPQDIAPASGAVSKPKKTELISGGSSVQTMTASLKKIRIADHLGKTRIVFEGEEKFNVLFKMNPNGRSATLTIAEKSITVDPSLLARKSALINHAILKDNTLQFILNSQSEKIAQGYLPPTKSNPNHRVYIDLKR